MFEKLIDNYALLLCHYYVIIMPLLCHYYAIIMSLLCYYHAIVTCTHVSSIVTIVNLSLYS